MGDLTEDYPTELCPECKQRIDPETCWCGDDRGALHDGHSFVPMGCRCCMDDPREVAAEVERAEE